MNKIRQELQKYKEWLLYDAKTIGYKANTDDVDSALAELEAKDVRIAELEMGVKNSAETYALQLSAKDKKIAELGAKLTSQYFDNQNAFDNLLAKQEAIKEYCGEQIAKQIKNGLFQCTKEVASDYQDILSKMEQE